MLMCSVGARPLWRARWLLLFQHVVSMTPFFFFFLDWKKYLYRSLLPQTEPTAEWNKPVLPSLWAARVTLGNVGNHRLNIKYWVVVRKKKVQRIPPMKCEFTWNKKSVFSFKNHNSEKKKKLQFLFCACFSSAFPTHRVIILERLSEELQGLCCGWVWEEKGGRQRFKTERRSAPEDEWGGGKLSWGLVVGKENDTERVYWYSSL